MLAAARPSGAGGLEAPAAAETLGAAVQAPRAGGRPPEAPGAAAPAMPGAWQPGWLPAPAATAPSRVGADDLWVVRGALVSPRACDLVVARAAALRVRGLLVQVVGRADAYYRSDLLPRAEALGPGDFDPLGYLLPRAREAGLEVQAWVNCFLAWSAPWAPRDSTHVVRRRPDWLMWARQTRRARGGARARVRGRQAELWAPEGEGFYLAAANPEVRSFLARVAGEIVTRYPVDGVHLDYVRYPDATVSVDSVTRAEFARHGAESAVAVEGGVAGAADSTERAAAGAAQRWPEVAAAGAAAPSGKRWDEFRGRQITRFVREVRDTLARRRRGVLLTAAVIADTSSARARHGQEWTDWLREGLLDRAYPMCYQPSTAGVMALLAAFKRDLGATRIVPGFACYNQPAGAVAAKMKVARALGFERVALYSYDALYSRPGYRRQLEHRLERQGAAGGAGGP